MSNYNNKNGGMFSSTAARNFARRTANIVRKVGEGIIESKREREIYRKIADSMFLEGMMSAEPEVSKWKIWSAYYAVRMFGRWAINSSEPRKGI